MEKLKRLDTIGVSIVIVTFNGKNLLQPTLEHLAAQEGIDFECELLVIDNSSTDGTADFVREMWEKLGAKMPLRIITEKKQGNMYARFNGIVNANYRYLLYCDDDNWFVPNYVEFAFNKIKNNPEIAVIGGQGLIEYENGFVPPAWIEHCKVYLACAPQGTNEGDIFPGNRSLYTAGAIIDRLWLDKLYETGFKSVLKGRDGSSLIGGEDTELTHALLLIGGKLHYYSDMKFKHFMPKKRINWSYIKKLQNAEGSMDYIIKGYHYLNKTNSKLRDYITISLLIVKYWLLSLPAGFKEGNKNTLLVQRFMGMLKMVGANHKNQFKIIDWMNSLKS